MIRPTPQPTGLPLPPSLATAYAAANGAPGERLRALVQWLKIVQATLQACNEHEAVTDADFWEGFLKELGGFEDSAVYEHLLGSPDYPGFKRLFSERFLGYAHYRDLARSRSMIEAYRHLGGIDVLSNDLRAFLEQEVQMLRRGAPARAGAPSIRRFLMVGCGACPETFLFYATHLGPKGLAVALECDADAAAIASKTIGRLGPKHAAVHHANGACFDYAGFDVIQIANYTSPKHAVLDAIARTADPQTRVILRLPVLLETLICESADLAQLDRFEEVDRITSHYCKMDSVLLRVRA